MTKKMNEYADKRTTAITPFGKLVANNTQDEDAPGICISIVECENGKEYERPLAVVETIEVNGRKVLRLVAWENEDFDSYSDCMTFLEREDECDDDE